MICEVKKRWSWFFSLLLLSGLVLTYFLVPDFQTFVKRAFEVLTSNNQKRIEEFVHEVGIWGPVTIILGMVIQMFLMVIPSFMLMIISILAYGPFWGTLIIIVAIFVASTIGFYIGKFLGPFTVEKMIGKEEEARLEFYVNRYGYWVVIIVRLVPFLSNDAISLVAGLLNMNYWKFIIATFAGIVPLSLLLALNSGNIEELKHSLIWITAISTVCLIIYILWDKKKRRT